MEFLNSQNQENIGLNCFTWENTWKFKSMIKFLLINMLDLYFLNLKNSMKNGLLSSPKLL